MTALMPSPTRAQGAASPLGWYTLGVLVVVYVLAFVDRQILSLLVEPLKQDLHLTDTQVSLLQGFAFAICLAIGGLPLGWLVDRTRRVTLIVLGVLIWSVMTVACGLAGGFSSLLLFRIGVGFGEAALTPAAHSIVSDSFPPRYLGLALGIFGIGSYIGSGLALIGGGLLVDRLKSGVPISLSWLGQLHAWQSSFLIVGSLGIPAAILVASLPEPPRQRSSHKTVSFADTANFFRRRGRTMARVNLTAAFVAMAVYASAAWIPSFYIRTYGLTSAAVGTRYGFIVIACGICGTIGGGMLADLLVARGVIAARLLVMTIASLCAAPLALALTTAQSGAVSFALLIPFSALTTVALGVLPSAQQSIADSRVRGVTAALGIVMVNLIGMGLGPTLVALFTDHVFHDEKLIRHSLAVLLPAMLCIASLIGWSSLADYRRAVTDRCAAG